MSRKRIRVTVVCAVCGQKRTIFKRSHNQQPASCASCQRKAAAHRGAQATLEKHGYNALSRILANYRKNNPTTYEKQCIDALIKIRQTQPDISWEREVELVSPQGSFYYIDIVVTMPTGHKIAVSPGSSYWHPTEQNPVRTQTIHIHLDGQIELRDNDVKKQTLASDLWAQLQAMSIQQKDKEYMIEAYGYLGDDLNPPNVIIKRKDGTTKKFTSHHVWAYICRKWRSIPSNSALYPKYVYTP